jgi:membrane protein
MIMTPRQTLHLFRDAGQKFLDDKATRLAAAIAYYSALSLSPLLLLVITIAGAVFGAEAARGEIQGQIRDMVGDQGAEAIQTMIANSANSTGGTVAAIVGLLTLVVGATGVFAQLQDSLNSIWKLPAKLTKSSSGIWTLLRERLLSLSLVAGLAFLLMVSLVLSAGVNAFGTMVGGWLPHWVEFVGLLNSVLSFLFTSVLFALIFKVLPEIRMAWSDVWLGAAITALFFALGKHLIGLYLGRSALGSTYGAAGAFVVLLVWIYYSSLLLLFGAEFTFLFAKNYGSGIRAPNGQQIENVTSEAVAADKAMARAGTPANAGV